MLRLGMGILVASLSLFRLAVAQTWAATASAGTVHLTDSSSLNALGGVVEYRALRWLTLGAAPTLVRSTVGTQTTSGFGDLPLTAAASKELGTAWGPELAAAVTLTVPTGNSACGLGSGVTSVGMEVGAGLSPADALHFSVDASRSLSAVTLSALDARGSTWLDVDADVDFTSRLTGSASLGGDFGGMDTTTAAREVGAGARYTLHGPLTLSVDVTHRLSGIAPTWGLAVTLGTASSGLSALNPSSPLWHQRQVFSGGVNIHGRGKSGGTGGC
ncbi:MAG TPA: hypothetical protein VNH14_05825 [Gemmatimonadales bacterium]|nr:hypothetical protein [Gemmatimonadales bacterium]